jgi:signal transduction histidine kinase
VPGPVLAAGGSVRLRTTAAATAVVLLTLAVGSWVLLSTLRGALADSQDSVAKARADDLLTRAAAGRLPGRLPSVGDDGFVQVVSQAGRVVAATPHVLGRPPVATVIPARGAPTALTVRGVRDDRDLENYRVWAVRGDSPSGPVTVYVATSLELVSETVGTLRRLLLVGVPLVGLLMGVVTWLVVGRALRPVEAIRAEVTAISAGELDRRVPEPAGDDEIARLARTMNAMLGRLEAASRRERAFTADASHELQSPLSAFRTQLEVALAQSTATDWPRVAHELLDGSQGMERMVRDLLFLAREDEDVAAAPQELVDLDDVVLEEAARARATSSVEIRTAAVSAAPVRGNREQLVRLTRNLIENAVHHAARLVEVSLTTTDGEVRMTVHDDGPGVPAAARDRIFDRFVRADDARSRQTGGSGLGLSIVATVARRHGGAVELLEPLEPLEPLDGAGATFVLRLPVAAP